MRIYILLLSFALAMPLIADDDFFKAVGARDTATVRTMLERDPSLATSHNARGASAVIAAMFALRKGENAFVDPAKNETLQAILATKPELDIYETAALGTTEQLDAMLARDSGAVNRRNKFGWTLLHLAAFAGNAGNTELLLKKGAIIGARAESRFRNTPLQAALLSGQYATAKLLLDHGADPLVRQAKGASPMHEAAFLGRRDLVELLLKHGAELSPLSDNGQTPLAEAIRGGHDELATWMRSKGAVTGIQEDEEIAKKK